ncbi:glucosamine-6-phosphate deaminase [Changchengzhania lutea]|uniref:glucosamine-6-phosphate deaminase n=1 Tax=Changchengzhania lutea TaxID=2049305 RepID=UPI00115EB8BC|nr:glucosamine-6-phosphate deaminase [Changchengzhania lutea]
MKTTETQAKIKFSQPGTFEDIRFEKIHNVVFSNSEEGSICVAAEMAELIKSKQENNKLCILGLATGSSPIKVYEELVRMHKEEELSFYNVVTFNLDEYYPMDKDSVHSYYYFMHQHLFNHIDISAENINIPNGTILQDDLHQYCINYDLKIKEYGGLDFQLLGIGRTGHIGFNEPGSHYNSGTRSITLDHLTRVDAAPSFLGMDNVPKKAVTMGIGTVKKAKRIVLLAWGHNKAIIVKKTIEREITSDVPASYLQEHSNTTFVLDEGASSECTRIKKPWIVNSCVWNEELKGKAIIWLCGKVKKPVLKLIDKDYNNHGMADLLSQEGSAYDLNLWMFNCLQHTITGWPGGKPNADDTYRPERANPKKKRVLILSPHPDDDVISMGGTLDRLVEQGHEVHVVYQTSGNIAVTDEEALKYVEVCKEILPTSVQKVVQQIIDVTKRHEATKIAPPAVRNLKRIIREKESLAAMRFLGVPEKNVHFLKMPFYETGTVKKNKLSEEDVKLLVNIIKEIKPHQIYEAGDLSDPHGTHRTCLDALQLALKELKNQPFFKDCWIWLYSGAWDEWKIHEIDMAIPLSPDQVIKKRHAIFYLQSQKDRVMFQGDDSREFWVRAEDRNTNTALNYQALGMAEYSAMEAFKRMIL